MRLAAPLVVALLMLASAGGCRARGGEPSAAEPVSAVSHDAHTLQAVMTLPATPLEVSFEEIPRGIPGRIGPTDYILVAALRFEADAVSRLIAAAPADAGSAEVLSLPNRPWLPAAVRAKSSGSDVSDVPVRGHALATESLLKSPYLNGSALVVEGTNYVVVVAYTM